MLIGKKFKKIAMGIALAGLSSNGVLGVIDLSRMPNLDIGKCSISYEDLTAFFNWAKDRLRFCKSAADLELLETTLNAKIPSSLSLDEKLKVLQNDFEREVALRSRFLGFFPGALAAECLGLLYSKELSWRDVVIREQSTEESPSEALEASCETSKTLGSGVAKKQERKFFLSTENIEDLSRSLSGMTHSSSGSKPDVLAAGRNLVITSSFLWPDLSRLDDIREELEDSFNYCKEKIEQSPFDLDSWREYNTFIFELCLYLYHTKKDTIRDVRSRIMGIEQECFVSNFDKEKIQSLITNLEKLLKEVDRTPEESYVPTPKESKRQPSKTAKIAKVKKHLAELRKLNEMFDREWVSNKNVL